MMKLFSTDSMKISVRIACDDDDTTFRYSFVLSMKDRKKDEHFFFSRQKQTNDRFSRRLYLSIDYQSGFSLLKMEKIILIVDEKLRVKSLM